MSASSWLRDLRQAARQLRSQAGVTAAAVLSLGLGIGANTTIFTWARAVLLQPFPGVPDQAQLLALNTTDRNEGYVSLSYPIYRELRDRSQLAGVVATRYGVIGLGAGQAPELAYVQMVSGNFFDVLGLRPQLGRLLHPEDDRVPGGHPLLVISHGLWQRSFGGDPGVVGREVKVNARPYTLVGVTAPGFKGTVNGVSVDGWIPLSMHVQLEPGGDRSQQPGNRWLDALVRLKPGVSRQQGQAELNAIGAQVQRQFGEPAERGLELAPLWRAPRSAAEIMGPVLGVLIGVAVLVLLIACANVAGLLLAQGLARRREVAVRLALGARRGDLLRQSLLESGLLALLGGALGTAVAAWAAGVLERLMPPTGFPLALGARVDAAALGVALAVGLVAALLSGLAPALQAGRSGVSAVLKSEAGSLLGGRSRLRRALVAGQVALSALLLVACGLLLRSLDQARSLELGFNPKGVLLATLQVFTGGYERERGLAFYRELLERAQALPGVSDASLVRRPPLGLGGASSTTVVVDGYDAPADKPAWGFYNHVGPGYFRTMQTPLVAGRDFGPQDDERGARVAIVDETMAARYWPGREALGGRIRLGQEWLTVVGVAKDTLWRDLARRPGPLFYLPVLQQYRPDVTLVLRGEAEPQALAGAVRAALQRLDPQLPVYNLRSLEAHIATGAIQQRLGSQVLGLFGTLGLLLAAVGLYGVLAHSVARRRREIGVRMALGGGRRAIFGLVLKDGLGLAAAGLGLGLLAAAGVTRFLAGLLVRTSPLDPATFAATGAVLAAVAFFACALPALRATRVDPLETLRSE